MGVAGGSTCAILDEHLGTHGRERTLSRLLGIEDVRARPERDPGLLGVPHAHQQLHALSLVGREGRYVTRSEGTG